MVRATSGTNSSTVPTLIPYTQISAPHWECRRAKGGTVNALAAAGALLVTLATVVSAPGCSPSASDQATASPSTSAIAETPTSSQAPTPASAPASGGWEDV